MKNFIFLIVFISGQFWSFGQEYNFENNYGMEVIIGSEPMDSLWQIGIPQKTIFSEAYSEPNAIMTGTTDNYPNDANASFILEINKEWFWSFPFMQIEWQQKFDVEVGVDGGIVEASYDEGITWQNVLSDTVYRPFIVGNYQIDSLFNGEIGFTGVSDWSFIGLCWGTPIGTHPPNVETIFLRFTFISDDNDTEQEGWMMDNFGFLGEIIGAASNENSFGEIDVYPNPTEKILTLKLPETNYENFALEISNNTGQTIFKENIRNIGLQNHQVSFENFSKGVYFIRLRIGDRIYQQRIVKI